MGVALDVRTDDGVLGVLQNSLQRAFRRFFEDPVDLLNGRVPGYLSYKIGYRAGGSRHTESNAVELTPHFGNHLTYSAGGPGAGGNNVLGGGPGPTQVRVALVQNGLVVGIGVDGGHQAALNAKSLMEHFDHRGEAVAGAGSVGDYIMLRSVVNMVIDSQ